MRFAVGIVALAVGKCARIADGDRHPEWRASSLVTPRTLDFWARIQGQVERFRGAEEITFKFLSNFLLAGTVAAFGALELLNETARQGLRVPRD